MTILSKILITTLGVGMLGWASVARAEAPSAAPEATPSDPAPNEFAAALHRGDWLSSLGLHASLGLAFGGDQLAELTYSDGSTTTVHAGEGVSFSGGLTWTPLWFGNRVGLGLGLDAGWKYKSTYAQSDGSVKLERVPLMASLRSLVAFGGSWHGLLAVGGILELKPHLYGDGVLSSVDARFDNALGGMMELGILWGRPKAFGFEITGRWSILSYEYMGESADASSGSINLTGHLFL
ncbi:hypothetical protein [Sorangium sp. So ce1389]|uniref:hypothetical protein n=1 Tax=Sorangium sp. So ce1389 TaxID=3133336 RepID=UPI003F61072B